MSTIEHRLHQVVDVRITRATLCLGSYVPRSRAGVLRSNERLNTKFARPSNQLLDAASNPRR